jgi:predicted transcriptional regulator
MTELTVNIEDPSMIEQIKQAISMLKGVASVTMKKKRRTGMERAVEDIEQGRIYEAESVEDLISQCKA